MVKDKYMQYGTRRNILHMVQHKKGLDLDYPNNKAMWNSPYGPCVWVIWHMFDA